MSLLTSLFSTALLASRPFLAQAETRLAKPATIDTRSNSDIMELPRWQLDVQDVSALSKPSRQLGLDVIRYETDMTGLRTVYSVEGDGTFMKMERSAISDSGDVYFVSSTNKNAFFLNTTSGRAVNVKVFSAAMIGEIQADIEPFKTNSPGFESGVIISGDISGRTIVSLMQNDTFTHSVQFPDLDGAIRIEPINGNPFDLFVIALGCYENQCGWSPDMLVVSRFGPDLWNEPTAEPLWSFGIDLWFQETFFHSFDDITHVTKEGDLVVSSSQLRGWSLDDELCLIDGQTGALKWSYSISDLHFNIAGVQQDLNDNIAYAIKDQAKIVRLDMDGELVDVMSLKVDGYKTRIANFKYLDDGGVVVALLYDSDRDEHDYWTSGKFVLAKLDEDRELTRAIRVPRSYYFSYKMHSYVTLDQKPNRNILFSFDDQTFETDYFLGTDCNAVDVTDDVTVTDNLTASRIRTSPDYLEFPNTAQQYNRTFISDHALTSVQNCLSFEPNPYDYTYDYSYSYYPDGSESRMSTAGSFGPTTMLALTSARAIAGPTQEPTIARPSTTSSDAQHEETLGQVATTAATTTAQQASGAESYSAVWPALSLAFFCSSAF